MKCNHLALAIGGCFSKSRTAALFNSVSEVSTARAPEQRRSLAWLPGMGGGHEAPTGLPVCLLGVPGKSWMALHRTKGHLHVRPLPISSGPAWKSCSPKLLLTGQGEEMGPVASITIKPHTLPSSPLKTRWLVHVSALIRLGC